jgi:KTSC domain
VCYELNVTTFNRSLWNLTSFEKIGYDKDKQLLTVFDLQGGVTEFSQVDEQTVFEFIISTNKEGFIQTVLFKDFSFKHYNQLSQMVSSTS